MKRALLWLLVLPLAVSAGAQTFSERTDVVVVEVPVQVIGGDGEPVRGLTAQDFEVYEGRKKLPVTGFEVLDLSATAAPAVQKEGKKIVQPVAARRHFLLLFDLAFSSPKTLGQAQDAARNLLKGLHPLDLVAVASYSPSTGPQLWLGFTSDKAQIEYALTLLPKPQMFDRTADPLRLVLGSGGPAPTLGATGGGGAQGGGKGAERRQEAKENVGEDLTASLGNLPSITRTFERAQQERAITAMSRAFADLAKTMGGLYGRKYVVLFSEGFDSSTFQGTANVDEQLRMAADSARGDYWMVDSDQRYGVTKTANDLEQMLEEFRRADCVVQTVDIGGLRERGGPEEQFVGTRDSLFMIADGTGGELYENFNDLSAAMAKMLSRTSVTYVLAFQPENIRRDGSYHRLRVEVKKAGKGARVVHRPGYYAPRPFGEQSASERMLKAAQQVVSGVESGAVQISVLAAAFPRGTDQAYVPVLVEIDGDSLLAGHSTEKPLPAEIYVYAMDADGTVVDYVSQNLGLDLAKVEPALRETGVKFFGHLDLPPGDYSVRVLVRNGHTGTAGLKVATVHVPPFTPADPVLLPAFFPEPVGKWLVVREAQREGDQQVAYPFMAGGEPFIPASQPVLAAGSRAKVNLVGYHLRPGELRAEARVLTADGREAGLAEIAGLQRLPTAVDGSAHLQGSFAPPPGLTPGEYMLMMTVTDSAGGSETSITPFVIAPRPKAGQGGEGS